MYRDYTENIKRVPYITNITYIIFIRNDSYFNERKHRHKKVATQFVMASTLPKQNHEYATQQRTLHMHRHSLGPSSTKTVISTQHPHHHILSHHTPVLSTRVLTGVSGTWPSVTSRLSKTRPQVRERRPQVRPSKASLECYAVEVSLRIFLDDGAVPIIQRRGCCGCVLVTKSARDCCRSSVRWCVIGKIDGWSSAFGLSWMSCRISELLCGEISVFPYPC